ncbi:hypothetical protein ADK67_10030 [Saccharothrix sp. NRRL B-16348]|uniref:hypothetical protein n=1 Tax=Saccharothrix sp. NRRL B-16348 TaxID=1415542 RepID=UPI0006AFCCBB|nr:hypothetical protein [Saccharothrix sp. NRRL B-16348]KOX30087.1 hypothetical protein ADK67_10030 [Saccharothrix sp. NRRL B-16348]
MEKSRGIWASRLAIATTVVQTASALLLFGGPPGEIARFDVAALGVLVVLSLPVNLAALVPMVRRVRRRAAPGAAVLIFCAVFLLWHGFALGTLAGWWASGFVGGLYLASSVPISFGYQVVMCGAFAAILALGVPRRGRVGAIAGRCPVSPTGAHAAAVADAVSAHDA